MNNLPNHIAIILDGNGRWAQKRKLPRTVGHYFGGQNIPKIINYANKLGIKEVSLFCFSTENWQRPTDEVSYLMNEPIKQIEKHLTKIADSNIKIRHIGFTKNLSDSMLNLLKTLEDITCDHQGLLLNICFNYGSLQEITQAALKCDVITTENIQKNLMINNNVDLLIRPGKEERLSNFLLWQSAYAELYFCQKYWPDFKEKDLLKAIKYYQKKNRRYGGIK